MYSLLGLIVSLVLIALAACAPPENVTATSTPPSVAGSVTPKAQPTLSPTQAAPAKPAATPAPAKPTSTAPPYYQGKTIELTVASGVGGGTDSTARAIALYLPRFLAGKPTVVVRNVPGGAGAVAASSFWKKAKPDGLSLFHSSQGIINVQLRGRDIVDFDLLKMRGVWCSAEGGTIIGIRPDALKRLTDPKAEPVVMGVQEATGSGTFIPLYGREFLGWNVRWLTGFGGSGEIVLALRRGESDMISQGWVIKPLLDEGVVVPLAQSGIYKDGQIVRSPNFPQVPTMAEVLGDKKPTGIPWQALVANSASLTIDKFTVAPPGTPDDTMTILTDAFARMSSDSEFTGMLKKTYSEVFSTTTGKDVTNLMRDIMGVPPEVAGYSETLLRKFGVIK